MAIQNSPTQTWKNSASTGVSMRDAHHREQTADPPCLITTIHLASLAELLKSSACPGRRSLGIRCRRSSPRRRVPTCCTAPPEMEYAVVTPPLTPLPTCPSLLRNAASPAAPPRFLLSVAATNLALRRPTVSASPLPLCGHPPPSCLLLLPLLTLPPWRCPPWPARRPPPPPPAAAARWCCRPGGAPRPPAPPPAPP